MPGSLTFFTGPMACGKTLELVRHLQIYAAQNVPTICIRPATDTRSTKIQSRSGLSYDGITIQEHDLPSIERILSEYQVIGIDEVQFFPSALVTSLENAVRTGKIVLVSGLDTDFRGQVFPTALALFSLPETNIHRSQAVCSICRQHTATRTQRLKNGQPVEQDEPVVSVEGDTAEITYEPRCISHHIVLPSLETSIFTPSKNVSQ